MSFRSRHILRVALIVLAIQAATFYIASRMTDKASFFSLMGTVFVLGFSVTYFSIRAARNSKLTKLQASEPVSTSTESLVHALIHEIKSPLCAIRGSADLIPKLAPLEQGRFVQIIRREAERVTLIINNLLDLVALEKREIPIYFERFDLLAALDEILSSLQPLVVAKELKVLIESGHDSEPVTGDPFLIMQSIRNLLQNAIEFSPQKGVITIHLFRDGDDIEIQVLDQGPGIPEYALPRVFDRFYSLRRPDSGQKSSGLGLNFVREVAKIHGGKAFISNRHDHDQKENLIQSPGAKAGLRLPL